MKNEIEAILQSKIVIGNPAGIKFFVREMEVFVKQKQKEAAQKAWNSGWTFGHCDGAAIMEYMEPNPETLEVHLKQYE